MWADAFVRLKDGSTLRLQDLPWEQNANYNPHAFSFVCDGRPSASLLPQWTRRAEEKPGLRRIVYDDPRTKLEVRVEATMFADFPAVEWVVHFKNNGPGDSPILESIEALDALLPGATLHSAKGAVASFDDFAPQTTALKADTKLHLQPGGGRSSNQVMPFFNLESGGGGTIIAIGWSGEWAADFSGAPDGNVAVRAGLVRTHLRLHAGEEIRTPRMLLLFYQGDRWRGQNLLRQFILKHHRPRVNGEPLIAPVTCGNWGGTPAEVHLDNIAKIAEQRLPIEYYWIDAEWYGNGAWATNVGNWTVKKQLYPEGFKPLSDALRATGRKLLLWFEPERVYKDTPWHREHRDWLLDRGESSALLNLGIPAARKFLTDFISARIEEFGLGCYRQDFNIDPLRFWQAADAPDRQGMTEIRYIEGLYAFWDELLARHPGLIIDNCASGGRRIDLETIGRATPLWRTDGPRDPVAHQCHTMGLMPWVPLSAASQDRTLDDYDFRSSMCSALCLNLWVHGDTAAGKIHSKFPFDWCRRTLDQYLEWRKFYYGDFYPLTAYSQAPDAWSAYQLDRPDLNEGLVVVLKRPASPYETARLKLRGLDGRAVYTVTNLDTAQRQSCKGGDLMTAGLPVELRDHPGSAVLRYQRR